MVVEQEHTVDCAYTKVMHWYTAQSFNWCAKDIATETVYMFICMEARGQLGLSKDQNLWVLRIELSPSGLVAATFTL